MDISMSNIEQLIKAIPGCAAAYQLCDDEVRNLGYTADFLRLFGYTAEEFDSLSANEINEMLAQLDRDRIWAWMKDENLVNDEFSGSCHLYPKDGTAIWVKIRAKLLGKLDGLPVLLTLLTQVSINEIQMDIINQIPVGMGVYEVEDGVTSLVYLNDSYYRIIGFTREQRKQYLGRNFLTAIHIEDRQKVLDCITKVMDGGKHDFRTVIRIRAKDEADCHWLQLEGRLAQRNGNRATIYVTFTKIDELEKAKQELEMSRAFMQAAMDSAQIQYFEYYPATHVAVGRDTTDAFHLPQRVENYPYCLVEQGIIHPDEEDNLWRVFRSLDEGQSPVVWEGRMLSNGRFRWYRCVMTALRNVSNRQSIVACTLIDITLEKEDTLAYRNHLDVILRSNPDAVASFRMNLTQNACPEGYSIYQNIQHLSETKTVDEFFARAEKMIPDDEDRSVFYSTFRRERMLSEFNQGRAKITLEHRYLLEHEHTEWITTSVDMMRNPANGEVEAVLYTLNTNARRVERIVMENFLQRTYDIIGVADLNTEEYFLFEQKMQIQARHQKGFWNSGLTYLRSLVSEDEWADLAPQATKEIILEELEKEQSYTLTFFSTVGKQIKRKQMSFFYADRKRKILIAAIRDFTDKELLEEFRYASEHDYVTHLYNRQRTFVECRKLMDAHPEEQFILCHLDILRFHLINSFYGEAEGNALLQKLGEEINRLAKDYPYAVYGRIEADVFCVCAPLIPALLEKDIHHIGQWLRDYRKNYQLEGSFGIYEVKDRTLPIEAMFARATMAAKQSRSVLVRHYGFFTDAMEKSLRIEQQITNEMRIALQQEQFKVYLQPKYLLRDNTPSGAEALVRWVHPERGMICPGDFIPLFEKNGFIIQLDQYMWDHVCRLLRGWIDEGKNPYPISVNVSRVSMYSPNTVQFLCDLMKKYALPRELLQLELTESAYMDDPDEMKKRLQKLQEEGFSILMDDFGSGYSSLNTLRELPVDYLKVDMRFLSATQDNERSRLILSAVIRMACWLNLPVITEGVETPEQMEFLNGIGCTYAQGYLFARPMPVAQYEETVLEKHTRCEKDQLTDITAVTSLIANTSESMRMLTESMPMPVAFVDLTRDRFDYIRANQEFRDVFGLGHDMIDKNMLLHGHMTENSYRILFNTFCQAEAEQGKAECIFKWQTDEGAQRQYYVCARYLGRSAYSAILLCVFIDVTNYTREEHAGIVPMEQDQTVYTAEQIEARLAFLRKLFVQARIVRPSEQTILAPDTAWQLKPLAAPCYRSLGKEEPCANCVSLRALKTHSKAFAVERCSDETICVLTCPINIALKDGVVETAVLEMVGKPGDDEMRTYGNFDDANRDLAESYRMMSYRDTLTGVWNRRYYNDMLYLEQNGYFRDAPSMGFILLDLRNFKHVNDMYGHMMGDRLLVQVAGELNYNIRPFDSVIRYGGDEFLVVMPSCLEKEVQERMEKLKKIVQSVRVDEQKALVLCISAGYGYTEHFDCGLNTRAALFQQANERMRADEESVHNPKETE